MDYISLVVLHAVSLGLLAFSEFTRDPGLNLAGWLEQKGFHLRETEEK